MTLARLEWPAFGFACLMTALALWLAPSWQGELSDPCNIALLLAAFTLVLLLLLPGAREKVLALFLASMPLVYLARGGFRWIEFGAFIAYALCAWMGLTRWPILLAVGIVAHGLVWDASHYFGGSAFMPEWYSLGCLIVDVGIGAYAAVIVARKS